MKRITILAILLVFAVVAVFAMPVYAKDSIQPFAYYERIEVKTNNPYDDFQAVVEIPADMVLIIDYVSASVGGDVRDEEEFTLTVSAAARDAQGIIHRPKHFVTKLIRTDRVSRTGTAHIQHEGGGQLKIYGEPPHLNISVTSNIATSGRDLISDVKLSGYLVEAN